MLKRISIYTCLILCVLLAGCQFKRTPSDSDKPINTSGDIRINEVMPDNEGFLAAQDGNYYSWAELYNEGDNSVSLNGYYLSDNENNLTKWQFPDVKIEPDEYLTVMLSGNDITDGNELHTDFKLNSKETELLLSSTSGKLISSLKWSEAIPMNVSCGFDGEEKYYGVPTPGEKNDDGGVTSCEYTDMDDNALVINEVLVKNKYSRMDSDGDRGAWVELYNASEEEIELCDYYIGDSADEKAKWRLPDIALAAGDYYLVWTDGKDKITDDGEAHASFRLSKGDDGIFLVYMPKLQCQSIPMFDVHDNVSYGRAANGEYLYYATPTPEAKNSTKGFDDITKVTVVGGDGVWINEVSAVSAVKRDQKDWIEIANGGDEDISLKGYYLSDDSDNPKLWKIPDITVEGGGYTVIYASSKPTEQRGNIAALGLSVSGSSIFLSNKDGEVVDVFETGAMRLGVTSGRNEKGARVFYTKSTPGQNNSDDTYSGYAAQPVFSHKGGYKTKSFEVKINCKDENAIIYYTTDGSKPTKSDRKYTGPISISRTTCLKAVAVSSGKLVSDVTVATYLFEKQHTTPVICLSGNQSDINTAYSVSQINVNIEKEVYCEYYEADGTLGVSFPCGTRVAGASTRKAAQKSLNVTLRAAYGQSNVTYPFFKDYRIISFKSFSLRNSGQDRELARIRDAYASVVVRDMDLDYAEYRLVTVYINGKYWGLYDLKENQNESYYASRFNTTTDNIVRIRRNDRALSGTNSEIKRVRAYARNTNMAVEGNYKKFCEWVDARSAMDYIIAQTFFGNSDMFNQKYACANDYLFKWRFLFFDLDYSLRSGTSNIIEAYFRKEGVPSANGSLTYMDIQAALLENPEWRAKFIERYAEHLKTTFKKDRLLKIYDAMVKEMEPEMPLHIARWGEPYSVSQWNANIRTLRGFIEIRTESSKRNLKNFFNLSDSKMKELFDD